MDGILPERRCIIQWMVYYMKRYIIQLMVYYLSVGAPLLLALAAGEQVSLGPSGLGHLVISNGFFGQVLPYQLQLITSHFLLGGRH